MVNRDRMQRLGAANTGRRIADDIRREFGARLDMPPESILFYDPETTERCENMFVARWNLARQKGDGASGVRSVYSRHADELARFIACISASVTDRPMLLFHDDCLSTGAIKCDLHAVLKRATCLCDLDGDDLLVMSEDGCVGVTLEHFVDRRPEVQAPVYRGYAWW